MRILWMQRLALFAASFLPAASASTQNLNLTNHTTRAIAIMSEDHPCQNVVQGSSSSASPGCLIFANDTAAVYSDPSNDYFGELSFVGTSALGTSTWLITVPQLVWQKALTVTLGNSGVTLSSNTDFEILFDSGSGQVAPNPGSAVAPNYWSAGASFSGVALTLVGNPDPSDYPFFGTPNNPTPPPPLGPPEVLSCGWAQTNDPNSPPSGTPSTPLGPGYPGASICLPAIQQPGFALSGPLANTAMTFFSFTTIQATGGNGALADAVWTAFKWKLQETVDTDGDGVPDQNDNCPFAPNGPALGSCTAGPAPISGKTCHVAADCGAGGACDVSQTDTGGVGSGSAPDGIGNVCQCGDANNNGVVDGADATLIQRAVANLNSPPGVTNLPGFLKCDVNANGTCDGADVTIISRNVANLAHSIQQKCHAATTYP
jgi:hypothetical protein